MTTPETQATLVVTVPREHGAVLAYRARCRTTLGAVTEVLAQATRHVLIAAPFLQKGYGVSGGPIRQALAAALSRGVDVAIASTARSLATLDLDALRAEAVGQLSLFRPRRDLAASPRLGSHAKFCVADGNAAYVGSANFTGPGLEEHVELGVLLHGALAKQVEDFWQYCLDAGLFIPYE